MSDIWTKGIKLINDLAFKSPEQKGFKQLWNLFSNSGFCSFEKIFSDRNNVSSKWHY